MPSQQTIIEALIERVVFLQQQLDESVWNETALITTLKELLPGFGPRFDQLRTAVEKVTSPRTPEDLVRFAAFLRKAHE